LIDAHAGVKTALKNNFETVTTELGCPFTLTDICAAYGVGPHSITKRKTYDD